MAQVCLAVARGPGGFNKLVVLKSLESKDETFRRMFLDEARLAALLHHPNVVNTYEVSETGGQYFVAMEYLDGQPLDKIIRETKKLGLLLQPRLCARIVADALSGLHYTHELRDYAGAPLGIVHRDISPHNLFLTYEGSVKLLDFGVAKSAARTAETAVGVLKGKLAYCAGPIRRSACCTRPSTVGCRTSKKHARTSAGGWRACCGERSHTCQRGAFRNPGYTFAMYPISVVRLRPGAKVKCGAERNGCPKVFGRSEKRPTTSTSSCAARQTARTPCLGLRIQP